MTDIGHYSDSLSCTADCKYDLSGCEYCGDGIIQSQYGEICDPNKFNTPTCAEFGKWEGPLQCKSDCTPDFELCDDVLRISQIYHDNFRYDAIGDLTFDGSGNLYVLGYTGSELPTFENESQECEGHFILETRDTINGFTYEFYPCWDIFLYKITPGGSTIWSKHWGTSDEDHGFSLINNSRLTAINYYESKLDLDTPQNIVFETKHLKASVLDLEGNFITKEANWNPNYHIHKVISGGPDKIIVAGVSENQPVLKSVSLENMEETDISPWSNEPGTTILDLTTIDENKLALLVYKDSSKLLQLWKYDLLENSLVLLHEIEDHYTGSQYNRNLSDANRSQTHLLIKHNNGDLYYLGYNLDPVIIRVTTDGSEINRYILTNNFHSFTGSLGNHKLAATASGKLIISNAIYYDSTQC